MKKSLFILLIIAVFLVYIKFDSVIEIVNDFKYPALDISVGNFSLEGDGVLILDVILENNTENPIFVDTLEITYIVVLDIEHYEETKRNFIVKKTIDKDQLKVFVMLRDYYNTKFEPDISGWIRQKKKGFGLQISVKDNSGKTIKWAKRHVDIST